MSVDVVINIVAKAKEEISSEVTMEDMNRSKQNNEWLVCIMPGVYCRWLYLPPLFTWQYNESIFHLWVCFWR